MGILSFILSPLEDIIKGLTEPVDAVIKIFGVVIKAVEGLIDLIEGLIEDIKSLFDVTSIEEIFLSPFKDVILLAISSVEKIFDLIKDDIPTFGGFKELIITPFKDVYDVIADFSGTVITDIEKIIGDIKGYAGNIESEVFSKVKVLVVEIESIPSHLVQIGERMKNNIVIKSKKLIQVVPEFLSDVTSAPLSMAKKIETKISTEVQNYDSVLHSLKNKFANENAVVDLFIVLIFIGIVALTGGLFYITRSFKVVMGVFLVMVVSILLFVIVELLGKFA